MEAVRGELEVLRERMVVSKALMQELADIAIDLPIELARRLESIAALGHACVSHNIDSLTAMLDASPLRAA